MYHSLVSCVFDLEYRIGTGFRSNINSSIRPIGFAPLVPQITVSPSLPDHQAGLSRQSSSIHDSFEFPSDQTIHQLEAIAMSPNARITPWNARLDRGALRQPISALRMARWPSSSMFNTSSCTSQSNRGRITNGVAGAPRPVLRVDCGMTRNTSCNNSDVGGEVTVQA